MKLNLENEKQKAKKAFRYLNRNREIGYYVAIIVWFAVYLLLQKHQLEGLFGTASTVVGAVLVWMNLKRSEKVNEAAYIKDLNNQFITNKNMTEVEHALELYYNQVVAGDEAPVLRLDLDRESEDCQKLINYLVYLESLAAIIDQNVIHIKMIHNVFAYRFFLAVNNPVVQANELYPYADYYKGCFRLAQEWVGAFENPEEEIPLYETRLRYTRIRKAKVSDAEAIASILMKTDPYIYPSAFGMDEKASMRLACLIRQERLLLSHKSIYLLETMEEGKYVIKAAMLYYLGRETWDTERAASLLRDEAGFASGQEEMFRHVAENYFGKIVSAYTNGTAEVVAIAAEPAGNGYGSMLLEYFTNIHDNDDVVLDVLSDNETAIRVYRRKGFVIEGVLHPGYAPKGKEVPMVQTMKISGKGSKYAQD